MLQSHTDSACANDQARVDWFDPEPSGGNRHWDEGYGGHFVTGYDPTELLAAVDAFVGHLATWAPRVVRFDRDGITGTMPRIARLMRAEIHRKL